jgi:precorrin-8X/cobalt-precorrin-8 methylmutase
MMLYAVGDPGLAGALRVPAEAVAAGVAALRRGCPVAVDVRMVAAALDRPLLERLGCELLCALDQPGAAELARQRGITRSAAAFDLLAERLDGAVVAIGTPQRRCWRCSTRSTPAAPRRRWWSARRSGWSRRPNRRTSCSSGRCRASAWSARGAARRSRRRR